MLSIPAGLSLDVLVNTTTTRYVLEGQDAVVGTAVVVLAGEQVARLGARLAGLDFRHAQPEGVLLAHHLQGATCFSPC